MFINDTIRSYVDKASAGTPTPGGGSVSALVGALGVTMGCMAANFTVGKSKYQAVEPQVRGILHRLEVAREALLMLTEEDSRAYECLSAALAMPKATDAEKRVREAVVRGGLRDAMAVPRRTMAVCAQALSALTEMVEVANPNLVSDVGVAAVLAEAALRGAKLNIEVNLRYLKDEAQALEIRREVTERCARAAGEARTVLEKVAAAIGGTP